MSKRTDSAEARKTPERRANRGAWLGGGIVLLTLLVVAWRMNSGGSAEWVSPKELDAKMPPSVAASTATSDALAPGSPQPGPAPPGKVWSTEHGHWHDIPPEGAQPVGTPSGSAAPVMTPVASPGTMTPQPEGPVPDGKVWSPEHGHWHDAGAVAPAIESAQPLQMTPVDGPGTLTPQPEGPVPDGKVWSPEHGHWHDAAPAPATPPGQ